MCFEKRFEVKLVRKHLGFFDCRLLGFVGDKKLLILLACLGCSFGVLYILVDLGCLAFGG